MKTAGRICSARLKYEQIKEQGQELDYFLHHRGDLCRGVKRSCVIERNKKVFTYAATRQAPMPAKAKRKKTKIFAAHTESGNQGGAATHRRCFQYRSCPHRLSHCREQHEERAVTAKIKPEIGICQGYCYPGIAGKPQAVFQSNKTYYGKVKNRFPWFGCFLCQISPRMAAHSIADIKTPTIRL